MLLWLMLPRNAFEESINVFIDPKECSSSLLNYYISLSSYLPHGTLVSIKGGNKIEEESKNEWMNERKKYEKYVDRRIYIKEVPSINYNNKHPLFYHILVVLVSICYSSLICTICSIFSLRATAYIV